MGKITNPHQAYLAALQGPCGDLYQEILEIREKSGRPIDPAAIANDVWRLGGWRLARSTAPPKALEDTNALRQELGLDPPDPRPVLAPVVVGQWQGHFLHARDFFQPGLASLPQDERLDIFKEHVSDGLTTILINAEQHDWGPSRGHPEWTHGGFNAYASDAQMQRLVNVCVEARSAGLNVWLGVVDQPRLYRGMAEILAMTHDLVMATWEHATGYMLSWEIREVWRDSTMREQNENRWISEIDWHDRHVGIHYQAAKPEIDDHDDGLGGGISRYTELESIYGPHRVTRMLQYHHSAPDDVLREQTRRTAGIVHRDHGVGAFCCFEHSSELNQPVVYNTHGVERRRRVIMEEVERIGLEPERTGFLN